MTDYNSGDTVRLTAMFYNWAGVLADTLTLPTIKIYDKNETLLTTIPGASVTKSATGTYYYDYTPPDKGLYVYEFAGTQDSTTILRRASFNTKFV